MYLLRRPHPPWLGELHVQMLQGLLNIVIGKHNFEDGDSTKTTRVNTLNHARIFDWHKLDKTVHHIRMGGK